MGCRKRAMPHLQSGTRPMAHLRSIATSVTRPPAHLRKQCNICNKTTGTSVMEHLRKQCNICNKTIGTSARATASTGTRTTASTGSTSLLHQAQLIKLKGASCRQAIEPAAYRSRPAQGTTPRSVSAPVPDARIRSQMA